MTDIASIARPDLLDTTSNGGHTFFVIEADNIGVRMFFS